MTDNYPLFLAFPPHPGEWLQDRGLVPLVEPLVSATEFPQFAALTSVLCENEESCIHVGFPCPSCIHVGFPCPSCVSDPNLGAMIHPIPFPNINCSYFPPTAFIDQENKSSVDFCVTLGVRLMDPGLDHCEATDIGWY